VTRRYDLVSDCGLTAVPPFVVPPAVAVPRRLGLDLLFVGWTEFIVSGVEDTESALAV